MNKLIVPVLSLSCIVVSIIGLCSCSALKKQPVDTRPTIVLLHSETNNTMGPAGEWRTYVTHDLGYKQGTNWVKITTVIQP